MPHPTPLGTAPPHAIPLKLRIHRLLEPADRSGLRARTLDLLLIYLVLLNVLAVILETVQSIAAAAPGLFLAFEWVSVVIFTLEYLLRVWSATADPRYAHPIFGRLRYMLTPMALLDLLAVLPFYLPMFNIDLRSMRAARLLRLAKLTRYSRSLQTLGAAVRAKQGELATVLFIIAILLVLISSLMYHAERDAQPDAFSSIPATMWWGVITLTTVGYGDTFPITPFGRVLGAIAALLGVGMFALPAGLLASGLIEQLHKRDQPPLCPHCGKPLPPQ